VRLSFDWSLPEAPRGFAWQGQVTQDAVEDDVIEFSWAGETARQVGTVVHRWLQRIAEDSLQGWNVDRIVSLSSSIRAALVVQGVSAPMLDAACERVTQALSFAVQDPRGRWLLGPHQEASNELRLRYVDATRVRTLILDRCFVDADGTRWVVDYKSSRHEGEDQEAFLDREKQRYRAQLERYATALGGARKGLYFPLLSAWRDW
jgi:ATP-dependent exoDNAse (exonuclease V) beta subunit